MTADIFFGNNIIDWADCNEFGLTTAVTRDHLPSGVSKKNLYHKRVTGAART